MLERISLAWRVLLGKSVNIEVDGYMFRVELGRATRLSTPAMRCPSCNQAMRRSDRKEDWHIDPSGYGQYSCDNLQCPERPRYRRVDVLEKAAMDQDQSREDKRVQEHRAYLEMNEVVNRLTLYLRNRYKGHFRGQFPNVAEIAIFIISGGKDGKVTKPLVGPDSPDNS